MFDFLIWKREADSTQEVLKRSDLPCGSVVVADRQKKGKGRKGRRWESQEGGLYFSFVLCEEDFSDYLQIPLVLGLFMSNFLKDAGIDAYIKWPNDIYAKGKKIAGILVEKSGRRIVAGVGLNVNQTKFPKDIEDIATSMRSITGIEYDRKDVLRGVLSVFSEGLSVFSKKGFKAFRDKVEERLLFKGEEVVILGEEEKAGVLLGIDKEGFLLLQTHKGVVRIVAGDLSLRLKG